MARGHLHTQTAEPAFVPAQAYRRYLVVRQDDAWLIKFDGRQYGPYASEREAMLFAIDAGHALGGRGAPTQVLRVDEDGEARPQWTYGQDPYPPRH